MGHWTSLCQSAITPLIKPISYLTLLYKRTPYIGDDEGHRVFKATIQWMQK